jgi:hypothetical protein
MEVADECLTWTEDNPTHAQDMYSILSGTANDVSMLIDYLPSYLFPTEERDIEWGVMGGSLGGHAVWLCLEKGAILTSPESALKMRLSDRVGMQCHWMSFLHRIDGISSKTVWITH